MAQVLQLLFGSDDAYESQLISSNFGMGVGEVSLISLAHPVPHFLNLLGFRETEELRDLGHRFSKAGISKPVGEDFPHLLGLVHPVYLAQSTLGPPYHWSHVRVGSIKTLARLASLTL